MKTLLKPDGKLFLYGIDYPDGVISGMNPIKFSAH